MYIQQNLPLLALLCELSVSVAYKTNWASTEDPVYTATATLLEKIVVDQFGVDVKQVGLVRSIADVFYKSEYSIEGLTKTADDIESFCAGVSEKPCFEFMKALLKDQNIQVPGVNESMAEEIKPSVMKHQVQSEVHKIRNQVSRHKTLFNTLGVAISAYNVYLGCAAVYQFANSNEDLSNQAKKILNIKVKFTKYLNWFLNEVLKKKDVPDRQKKINYFATKVDESTFEMKIVKMEVEAIAQRSKDTAATNIFTGASTLALSYIFPGSNWARWTMRASGVFSAGTSIPHFKIVWDADGFGRDIQDALDAFKEAKKMTSDERDEDLPVF